MHTYRMEEEEEEPEFAAISATESVPSADLPPFPLRPGTRELLRFAVAITMIRGAKAITDLDVVLASLARFYLTDLDGLICGKPPRPLSLRFLPSRGRNGFLMPCPPAASTARR